MVREYRLEMAPLRIPDAPLCDAGYRQVRPLDVVAESGLVLVDVREAESDLLGDLGHVHGVRHVPAERLLASGVTGVTRDAPVVVICSDGRLSQRCATELVATHGYTEVYHLVGGMLRWNAEDRPIARQRTWS
jgi:rhodanese-related sulfurtransferase